MAQRALGAGMIVPRKRALFGLLLIAAGLVAGVAGVLVGRRESE